MAFHASGLATSFGLAYAGITYGVGCVQPVLDLLPAAVSAHIPEGAGTVAVAFLLAECTAPPRCLDPNNPAPWTPQAMPWQRDISLCLIYLSAYISLYLYKPACM